MAALERWARRVRASVVLDGEIVALDERGDPVGFQHLQRRANAGTRMAFIVFDLLRERHTDLRDRPLLERRARLERLVLPAWAGKSALRISEVAHGNGQLLYSRAMSNGWEGIIAKRSNSTYRSGKRTPDWRKLKIVREQEFVIGGWTEPRHTRSYFGALLLGVHDVRARSARNKETSREQKLTYVGLVGTGFDERELARMMKRLRSLETAACPFTEPPRTEERAHWIRPELVAQIRFTEWTADGRLRHPVYLGLRDDKDPRLVTREPDARRQLTVVAARAQARTRGREAWPSAIGCSMSCVSSKKERAMARSIFRTARGSR